MIVTGSRFFEFESTGVFLAMLLRFASFACVLFIGSSIFAHEGHGHPEHTDGILHYVVNPSHAGSALIVAIAAVAIFAIARRVLRSRTSDQ